MVLCPGVGSWNPLPPPLYPQPSSSFPHIHHSFLSFPYSDYSLNHFPHPFSYQILLLEHLSSLFLVYQTVSSPSLSSPSCLSINHPLSIHVQSNSSYLNYDYVYETL